MSRPMRKRHSLPAFDKLSLSTKKSSQEHFSNYPLKKRMTRASKKIQEQDENNVPRAQKVVVKERLNKRIPPEKSRVLRDKTNEVSDFSKTDFSQIVVKETAKEPEVIRQHLDQLDFETDSHADKKENSDELQITKESKASSLQGSEQIKLSQDFDEETALTVKRNFKTKSAQIEAERSRVQDKPLPKTNKFFKSRNSNDKPISLVGQELAKGSKSVSPFAEDNTKMDTLTDFSNTFDLMENVEVQQDEQTVPLFTDLEPPCHFKTPPKSVYQRKRLSKSSVCGRSENEENRDVENWRVNKKAKKTCKKDMKSFQELEKWVETVNKTFEDIDSFNLVVE